MTTTELAVKTEPKQAEIRFSVTVETIKPMAEKYLALKINGVNDVKGREAVKEAAKACQKARTKADDEHDAAKREYLVAGRAVDAFTKKIKEAIAPIETHLKEQLRLVEAEEKRIEDERIETRFQQRSQRFSSVGGFVPGRIEKDLVRVATEERIEELLDEAKAYHEQKAAEEKARIEEEERREAAHKEQEERNRIESERLAAERAEFERQKAEEAERQRIAQAKIDEQNRIEAERVAAERAIEQKKLDEQRAAQKAEQDRLDAIQRKIDDEKRAAEVAAEIESKAKEKADAIEKQRIAEQERAAQAEAKRVANLPIKEKLTAYRDALLAVDVPIVEHGNEAINLVRDTIHHTLTEAIFSM